MICDIIGVEDWIVKFDWDGLLVFKVISRVFFYIFLGFKSRDIVVFYKVYMNLEFYYIMKVGYMVFSDNGEMVLEMVKRVIG